MGDFHNGAENALDRRQGLRIELQDVAAAFPTYQSSPTGVPGGLTGQQLIDDFSRRESDASSLSGEKGRRPNLYYNKPGSVVNKEFECNATKKLKFKKLVEKI